MLAVTFTDQVGVGTLILTLALSILAVPSSVLAWHSVKRQRLIDSDTKKREETQRLTRAVAREFGIEMRQEPDSGEVVPEKRGPQAVTVIEATAHQLKPSNGKTVATIVEEIHAEVKGIRIDQAALAVALGEHTRDGHGE